MSKLTKDVIESLKKEYPDIELHSMVVGDVEIVHTPVSMKLVSGIKQKQLDIIQQQRASLDIPQSMQGEEVDIPQDKMDELQIEADVRLAEYIWDTVVIWPKEDLPETIKYAFSEAFVERFVFVRVGASRKL